MCAMTSGPTLPITVTVSCCALGLVTEVATMDGDLGDLVQFGATEPLGDGQQILIPIEQLDADELSRRVADMLCEMAEQLRRKIGDGSIDDVDPVDPQAGEYPDVQAGLS